MSRDLAVDVCLTRTFALGPRSTSSTQGVHRVFQPESSCRGRGTWASEQHLALPTVLPRLAEASADGSGWHWNTTKAVRTSQTQHASQDCVRDLRPRTGQSRSESAISSANFQAIPREARARAQDRIGSWELAKYACSDRICSVPMREEVSAGASGRSVLTKRDRRSFFSLHSTDLHLFTATLYGNIVQRPSGPTLRCPL
jgi:hypothetical protein